MQWENSLNAFVAGHSSDGKCLVDASALTRNYCAGKDLSTYLVAFLDPAMDIHRIADFKVRRFFLETFVIACYFYADVVRHYLLSSLMVPDFILHTSGFLFRRFYEVVSDFLHYLHV